jgi:hypothetical protein
MKFNRGTTSGRMTPALVGVRVIYLSIAAIDIE